MDSLIQTFHLDWRLMLAQIINFGIVFGVLYWFVFRPLFKTVAERNQKIEQGLAEAKQSAESLIKAEADGRAFINQSKQEAAVILQEAREQAEVRRAEMLVEARAEIGQVINQEKIAMQQEKAVVLNDIKKELAGLISEALIKLLPEAANLASDKRMIDQVLKK